MAVRLKFYFILTYIQLLVCISITCQSDHPITIDSFSSFRFSDVPKPMWELGIHGGHFFIDGDVDRAIPGGYGVGLHIHRDIQYGFSLRGDLFYGIARGLDPQPWSAKPANIGTLGTFINNDGGLVEPVFDAYRSSETDGIWFPSHETRYTYIALQGIINIGNILFHKGQNKWNTYLALGFGLDNNSTKLDLLDAQGLPYSDLINATNWSNSTFDQHDGRREIKNNIRQIYDGKFETEGFKKVGIFRLGDETNIHVIWTSSIGISRKITNRFSLALEHEVIFTDNDYLDGIKYRTTFDQTNNVDISHYTHFRLSFNLSKTKEPLRWRNPLNTAFEQLASLKRNPKMDLTDSDGDGVIDLLDLEPHTSAGCKVNIKGISQDSDQDGLIDCIDDEPFSPIGYKVNEQGIAIRESLLTMENLQALLNTKADDGLDEVKNKLVKSKCGKWFIPILIFNATSDKIESDHLEILNHVSSIMKICPDITLYVNGNEDVLAGNQRNKLLSHQRAAAVIDYLIKVHGIESFRLILENTENTFSQRNDLNRKLKSSVSFTIQSEKENE